MTTMENSTGVPADGHFGVSAGNPLLDGSSGVPSPFGSPPSIWCKAIKRNGEPCKGKHLPDRDVCFAHAKG
jgi:hypothetical protein